MLNDLYALIQEYFGLTPETQNRLFSSAIIILVLWIGHIFANRFINRRFVEDPRTFYNARRISNAVFGVLGVFLVGRIWLEGIQSLATYLGLLSAGLAIALQDLLVNLSGWLFVTWRRPFDVGDRIEVDGTIGEVIDLRLFAFSLLEVGNRVVAEQSTGRVIHVPNGRVFKAQIANFNQGLPYIWNEIPIMITFESDWEKAKRLIETIIRKHAPDVREGVEAYNRAVNRRFVITYKNLTPTVYTQVVDSGVLLTMRYMIKPRQRRGTEQAIYEDILRAFAQHWDIDFAYPTQREYIHYNEAQKPPTHEAPTVVFERPRPEDEPPRQKRNPPQS